MKIKVLRYFHVVFFNYYLFWQLEQRIEAHNYSQITLDEKRSELMSMETQLREVEDKYYNQTLQLQDKVASDLKVMCRGEGHRILQGKDRC